MTADAQARGVEEEAKEAAEKERFILEAAGMNVVSAINHGFTYEHGYLAGYRAAEEKAKGTTPKWVDFEEYKSSRGKTEHTYFDWYRVDTAKKRGTKNKYIVLLVPPIPKP